VINAFPGATGDSTSFTYIDYLDSNKVKILSMSLSSDNVLSITAPAMTVAGTVIIRLQDAPTSVTSDSAAIANPQYDATAKKLTVPFDANTPITMTINGVTAGVKDRSGPVKTFGRMTARHTNQGMELTIPTLAGIGQNAAASISVFDVAGRSIVKKEFSLNQYAGSPIRLTLAKGVYIAKLDVQGVAAGKLKIVAP
jgi:hypothetical protein